MKEREVRELASVEGGDKIGPKSVSEWRGKTLMIPPLPPTNLRGCHLIKIYYDLVVSFPFSLLKNFSSLIPWVFFLSFFGSFFSHSLVLFISHPAISVKSLPVFLKRSVEGVLDFLPLFLFSDSLKFLCIFLHSVFNGKEEHILRQSNEGSTTNCTGHIPDP